MCKDLVEEIDVLNILRAEAARRDPLIKVNVVKPPTYVELFYGPDEKPSEIILIYKEVIVYCAAEDAKSETPGSEQSEFDLTGHPLEAPFENLECDISIPAGKQCGQMWHKSEENHLPVLLDDARSIISGFSLEQKVNQSVQHALDIWAVTKPNPSEGGKKKRHDVLLGLRFSKADKYGKLYHFARSVVTLNSPCSVESPDIKTSSMMKQHLDLCGSNINVKSKVRCIYNLPGDLCSEEDRSVGSALQGLPGCYLNAEWKQPKMEPPLQETVVEMTINVVPGEKVSDLHFLWRQLSILGKLYEILGIPRNKLKAVEMLPSYSSNNILDDLSLTESMKVSVPEQLKKLFRGEFVSQMKTQSDAGFAESSCASGLPNRTTMHRPVDNSKENKFKRNIKQVLFNQRINADATDDLWNILSGCDTLNDLCNSFDIVCREVKQGHWKPFIRPKNQSHTSALLRALSSDSNHDNLADIIGFDSNGIHVALESLFELGLEKMANDYSYLLLESDLASWDDLHVPPFPRKGFGVSRESWLEKCNEYLTWLTKVHAALEVIMEAGLRGIKDAFNIVASQALSYFQGAQSPIQSAKFLSVDNPSLIFKAQVEAHQMSERLSRPFDLWQLTLTSESSRLFVETVFHRSMLDVFPPQIVSGGAEHCIPVNSNNESTYCNCKLVTLMNRL